MDPRRLQRLSGLALAPIRSLWALGSLEGTEDPTVPSLGLNNPTGGNQNVSVPYLAASGALYSPSLSPGEVTVAAPYLAASGALYAPTLAAGNVNVAVPFLAASGVLYQPTLVVPPNADIVRVFTYPRRRHADAALAGRSGRPARLHPRRAGGALKQRV